MQSIHQEMDILRVNPTTQILLTHQEDVDTQITSADKMILQVSDALSFMKQQIINDSKDLLSKIKCAEGRKQIDGYWNEFQGLRETFDADWKNLEDQMVKMFGSLQVSFCDYLESYHEMVMHYYCLDKFFS